MFWIIRPLAASSNSCAKSAALWIAAAQRLDETTLLVTSVRRELLAGDWVIPATAAADTVPSEPAAASGRIEVLQALEVGAKQVAFLDLVLVALSAGHNLRCGDEVPIMRPDAASPHARLRLVAVGTQCGVGLILSASDVVRAGDFGVIDED